MRLLDTCLPPTVRSIAAKTSAASAGSFVYGCVGIFQVDLAGQWRNRDVLLLGVQHRPIKFHHANTKTRLDRRGLIRDNRNRQAPILDAR